MMLLYFIFVNKRYNTLLSIIKKIKTIVKLLCFNVIQLKNMNYVNVLIQKLEMVDIYIIYINR